MNEVNGGIKAATVWAARLIRTKRKWATMRGYNQMYDKMLAEARMPGAAGNSKTRQSERASARFILACKITAGINTGDTVEISNAWKQVQEIQALADANTATYEAGEWVAESHCRSSKKASIQSLNVDWREQLCELMRQHRYANVVKVLSCVGCRPEEISKGVQVYHDTDGIHFIVDGAKLDEIRGQEWREIILPLDHHIASLIPEGIYQAQQKSLTEAIIRKAKRLKFTGVSAYSFRHQFSSDLKASKFSKNDIAKALGHQSASSQETYGNCGKGRQVTMKVFAKKDPRHKAKKVSVNKVRRASAKNSSPRP